MLQDKEVIAKVNSVDTYSRQMDLNYHEKDQGNVYDDSLEVETFNESRNYCVSVRRSKYNPSLSKSKAVRTSTHSVNLGRIDKDKRSKLKQVLNSCILKARKMINSDIKQDTRINLIVQNIEACRLASLKAENDPDHKGHIAEMNNPNPYEFHGQYQVSKDNQSVGLPNHESEPIQASSSDSTILYNDKNKINNKFAKERKNQNEDSHSIEIKQEPDNDLFNDPNCFNEQEETNKATEDEQSNQDLFKTPKRFKDRELGKTTTGSLKKSKRSMMKNESNNHKITEYFPKTSKYRTPITQNGKREYVDPSFIISALKGDPNYCIVCEKNFVSSYIKKHLVEQHGINKNSIRNRPSKRENTNAENAIDTNRL